MRHPFHLTSALISALTSASTCAGLATAIVLASAATSFAEDTAPSAPEDTAPSTPVEPHSPYELGSFAGGFFPSKLHGLRGDDAEPGRNLEDIAFEIGTRFGYFPLAYLGAEAELSVMLTRDVGAAAALLYSGRAHIMARLPTGPVTPFVVAGIAALGVSSGHLGSDLDSAGYFGIGVKHTLSPCLAIRLDLRDMLTTRLKGADQPHNLQLLMGITWNLGASATAPQASMAEAPVEAAVPLPTVTPAAPVTPVTPAAPATAPVAPVTPAAPATAPVAPVTPAAPATAPVAPVTPAAPVAPAPSATQAEPGASGPKATVAPAASPAPQPAAPAPLPAPNAPVPAPQQPSAPAAQ